MVRVENRAFPAQEIASPLAGANPGMAPPNISSITNRALPRP
ncbi:MAG: hypothetical protein ABSC18_04450 [Verrucomicrobiota bacterium]|jgi:hypothetical protein